MPVTDQRRVHLAWPLLVAVLLAASVLAAPSAAVGASPNSGTVAIVGNPPASDDTDGQVCDFRVVGTGFSPGSDLVIDIVGFGRPGMAGPASFSTTLTADAAGEFDISGPALPDGRYRLTVQNLDSRGNAKVKNFRVACEAG